MEREEALKSLETIKNVIEETRIAMSVSGHYWVLWGILVMLGCAVEQIIWPWHHWAPHLILWGSQMLLGVVGTVILLREGRKHRVERPFGGLTRKLGAIWASIFVFIWFMTYLSVGLKLFASIHIWAMSTLVDALGLFITGVLLSSRSFIILSLLGLPVVIFMVLNPFWQASAFGIYIGGGSAVIGWLFSRPQHKGETGHGSYMA